MLFFGRMNPFSFNECDSRAEMWTSDTKDEVWMWVLSFLDRQGNIKDINIA